MKRNFFYGVILALVLGSLSSCSDNLTTDVQEKVDSDQVRYLNVSISSPTGAGTRAIEDNDFKNGLEDENFVQNMTFVFYDAAGLPTGQAYELTFTENTTDKGFKDNAGNVGKIWHSTVPVQLTQGQNLPSYVMCFINPASTVDFKNTSLEKLKELERQSVYTQQDETKSYFRMSNSVYYGTNPITGQSNVRMYATPIVTDQLYPTEQAASADNAQTIDIYVERYAARIELNMPGTLEMKNTGSVNGYTLTFVPEYWRPNAVDQNMYAIKRYGLVSGSSTNYEPSYNDLGNSFAGTWWNDADRHRSYWACSPSYYANEYPKVSDDITDITPNNNYNTPEKDEDGYDKVDDKNKPVYVKYPFSIHYFNYNQFGTGQIDGGVNYPAAIKWNSTDGFKGVYYARETTTASSAWGYQKEAQNADAADAQANKLGYNPLATIPSVVILGHYTVTKTGTEVADVPTNEKTFYLFGKTESKHNLYFETGENNIKKAMIKQQNVVLLRTGNNTYVSYRPESIAADIFKVDHPSKEVRQIKNTTVAGRLVALQFDNDAINKNTVNLPDNLYYYDATQGDGKKYVNITRENLDKVNSDLLSVGYASKYGDGITYFNIPIEHLGIYNDDATDYMTGAKDTKTGKYDFTKCPAGSFGIVRNHAYTINVNGISGLGSALRDKNQPIVPPVDETEYYISAKVNILNWRIVPAQDVVL